MRWSDLTRPERAFALIARLFLGLFIFILVASTLQSLLMRMELSPADLAGLLVGLGLLSVTAYVIRERPRRERPRLPRTRGAERTPLLPNRTEEE